MILRVGFYILGSLLCWVASYQLVEHLQPRALFEDVSIYEAEPAHKYTAAELTEANWVLSWSALAACALPGLLTLIWTSLSVRGNPEMQLLAALGGTGVRMGFVLVYGMVATRSFPYFQEHQRRFWGWILLFYLFTLALEMLILARAAAPVASPAKAGE